MRRCPSPTWRAPKRRKRRKSSRNVTAAGMGAAVSSGGRVLVCVARYADGQNAYIIEDKHNIPHFLTLRMSQRDGFGLPVYAQNKRQAQQHLLSAIKGHSSRLEYRYPHASASEHEKEENALQIAESAFGSPSSSVAPSASDAKEEVHRLEEEKFRLEEQHQKDMWAAKRTAQRHLLSQLSTGIKVDAEIKVKSAKEAKNSCADLTPSNVNKELSAAGEKCWEIQRSKCWEIQRSSTVPI